VLPRGNDATGGQLYLHIGQRDFHRLSRRGNSIRAVMSTEMWEAAADGTNGKRRPRDIFVEPT